MIFARKRSRATRNRAPVASNGSQPDSARDSRPVPRDSRPVSVVPEELIAARAYEKWQMRGCPMGQDGLQDWLAAKAELEEERLSWAAPEPDDRARGV